MPSSSSRIDLCDGNRDTKNKLAIKKLAHQVLRNLILPFISVGKKLFLVVQKFFMGLGCKFVIGTFHDGIYGACLLTEPTINAFGHVDVITGCSTSSVFAGFGLDRNGLSGADCLTKFTGDAAFVSGRVSPQRMLPSETWTQVSSLKRIVDGDLWFETHLQSERQSANNLGQEKDLGGTVKDCFPRSRKNIIVIDIWILGFGGPGHRCQRSKDGRCSRTRPDEAETSRGRLPKHMSCGKHQVTRCSARILLRLSVYF